MADGDSTGTLMSSSKESGAMQVFFQEHLLSLVRPVLQQVADIHSQVNTMEHDLRAKDAALASQGAKLEQHEQQLRTLAIDFAQAKTSRRLNQQSEDVAGIMKGLHQEEAKVADVVARMKDIQRDMDSLKPDIEKLQIDGSKTGATMDTLDADVAKLNDAVRNLNTDYNGITQHCDRMKSHVDTSNRQMESLASFCNLKHEEHKKYNDDLALRLETTEAKLMGLTGLVKLHDDRLGSTGTEVERIRVEQGRMKEALDHQVEVNEEQEESLKQLNVKQAITMLFQRLDKQGEELTALAKDVREDQATLKDVSHRCEELKPDIAKTAEDVERLEKKHNVMEHMLVKADRKLDQHGLAQAQLKEQVDVADADIRSLTDAQNVHLAKLENHARDINKTHARLSETERKLDTTGSQVTKLHGELAAANEGMSKTAVRLDLAHDYLHGMSKGIQDAHQRISIGNEATPFRTDIRPSPRKLPALPGSARF
eukprot:CAMPEP_0117593204 /NCGR_PEP_ID=MMETSP0784-20121206/72502_1 /TAXON_ID=39447 /ORGANISM="" /LENGTH=482 /DNA_ID=CAMNT_0005395099 /DNA_START=43 /DNA_END=1491 /DNA_ORIENTATION=-